MPTPFAPYANLRLLIPQPQALPADFRSGVPASTASWVLQVFIRGPEAGGQPLPSTTPQVRSLSGYITAWAVLPAGTSWLAAASAFSWDTTGLAPTGLAAGLSGRGFFGDLSALPATSAPAQVGEASITGLFGRYGTGGIGAELRTRTGDAIDVELQVPA